MNDEKREQIYQENGEKGLDAYLGTPQEIEYDRINQVLAKFHAGASVIELKKMGRFKIHIYDHPFQR